MTSLFTKMNLSKTWWVYTSIFLLTILAAIRLPVTIDEAYYLAFSKHLQLSYVDHPPFVAYLNILQVKLGLTSPLSIRSSVLFLHWVATYLLMTIVYQHCKEDRNVATKLLITFCIAYTVPIFSLFGIILRPDCPLLLALSIMLVTADNIMRTQIITWKKSVFLGLGLGIGLLAKYHIVILGGGILLGLLIDLAWKTSFQWTHLLKLMGAGLISLVCALPVLIWNYHNEFASFLFQFQHIFQAQHWQPHSVLGYLLGTVFFLTPMIAVILIRQGLFRRFRWSLCIPVLGMVVILLLSSLRKNVHGEWACPAFWLLIPYAVIYSGYQEKRFNTLIQASKYTAAIWIILLTLIIVPHGIEQVRHIAQRFDPTSNPFKSILFWDDLPHLIHDKPSLTQAIEEGLQQKQNPNCSYKHPLIGALNWRWAAELEYHHFFPGMKVLNLDLRSSNFYLWRDTWSKYANCRILLITDDPRHAEELAKIVTVNQAYDFSNFKNYEKLHMQIVTANLHDKNTLDKIQRYRITHPQF